MGKVKISLYSTELAEKIVLNLVQPIEGSHRDVTVAILTERTI